MSDRAQEPIQNSGILIVIAAPSGGGKTSLVRALLDSDPNLRLSISHTTRSPRPGETSGTQYHYTDPEDFRQMVENGEFLEHAVVFGNHYGTHAGALAEQLSKGFDVILEIDWQGAAQVRRVFPACCTIFILPPSLDALRQRLARRAQDSEDVIAGRMREARSEISHWDEFDHIVVNDRFEDALAQLRDIIDRYRRGDVPERNEHPRLVAELLGNG